MIDGKGLGNKRINRTGISLSNHYDGNLRKLATACNFNHHTTLAGHILELKLDDIPFINWLQDQYCTQNAYRIVPVNVDGKVIYTLRGRYDI